MSRSRSDPGPAHVLAAGREVVGGTEREHEEDEADEYQSEHLWSLLSDPGPATVKFIGHFVKSLASRFRPAFRTQGNRRLRPLLDSAVTQSADQTR